MTIESKAHEAMLAVSAVADPGCRHPRKRLQEMRRIMEGGKIDKLGLARVLLNEVGREDLSPQRRAAWRNATRKLAREIARRKRAER